MPSLSRVSAARNWPPACAEDGHVQRRQTDDRVRSHRQASSRAGLPPRRSRRRNCARAAHSWPCARRPRCTQSLGFRRRAGSGSAPQVLRPGEGRWTAERDQPHALAHPAAGSTARAAALFSHPDFNISHDAGTLIAICAPSATFSTADCWLAAENLMLAACAMGLGTCCIGSQCRCSTVRTSRRSWGSRLSSKSSLRSSSACRAARRPPPRGRIRRWSAGRLTRVLEARDCCTQSTCLAQILQRAGYANRSSGALRCMKRIDIRRGTVYAAKRRGVMRSCWPARPWHRSRGTHKPQQVRILPPTLVS